MIGGQAAGVAAAQAARRRAVVHDIDVDAVRRRLAATGQVLDAR